MLRKKVEINNFFLFTIFQSPNFQLKKKKTLYFSNLKALQKERPRDTYSRSATYRENICVVKILTSVSQLFILIVRDFFNLYFLYSTSIVV